ncbi:MAG: hypothetical protein ABSE71_01725 [Candidatus Micrarchaeaceae archaeon]|jgi:hypothetical protein|nr:hypothetical protein [Candidatus Micrarchaeota archaeon]HII10279.1 hypothetical protein [Candidatus Micrarchaeota archaeon]
MVTTANHAGEKRESRIVMKAIEAKSIQVTDPQGAVMAYEDLRNIGARHLTGCKVSALGHDLKFYENCWSWSDGNHSVLSTLNLEKDTAIAALEKAYRTITSGSVSPAPA